jgi:hypothetical protein
MDIRACLRSMLAALAPTALVLAGGLCEDAHAQQQVPCDLVTGAGKIDLGAGKASFGFEGAVRKGAYWGGVDYRDPVLDLRVESTSISRYAGTGPYTRVLEGQASTNLYGTRSYRVTAYDGQAAGARDTFRIELDNGYSRSGMLISGNVELHKGNRNSTPPSGSVCGVPSDTTAPAVVITSPDSGATVSNTITVSADASDDVAVAGVQFKLDGAPLGVEDTVAPYSVNWDTNTASNGSHTVTAVARDAAGNTATSSPVTVTVANAPAPAVGPDLTPPSATITSPASGAMVSATINVAANASDNVGVAGVQFRLDGTPLGPEDTTAPYSVSWNTTTASNGSHVLSAVARDTSGNLGPSSPVTVTVSNGPAAPPDVFVSLTNGQVQWRAPDGTLRQVMLTGSDGQASSLAFDAAKNLYVPHWWSQIPGQPGNVVMKMDYNATLGTYGSPHPFGSGYDSSPSSLAFDALGNVYVGQAEGTGDILKFDAAGNFLASYDVLVTNRGTDHIYLAGDGCTMFYTSRDKNIYRYNVCTRTQLPIFNLQPLPGWNAYHLVILPNHEVLVADSEVVVRVDAAGNVVQTYNVEGQLGGYLYGGVDYVGDGTFWASNGYNSNVFRFDIQTGAVLASFNTLSGDLTTAGVAVRR